jgi:hypothetical protein
MRDDFMASACVLVLLERIGKEEMIPLCLVQIIEMFLSLMQKPLLGA